MPSNVLRSGANTITITIDDLDLLKNVTSIQAIDENAKVIAVYNYNDYNKAKFFYNPKHIIKDLVLKKDSVEYHCNEDDLVAGQHSVYLRILTKGGDIFVTQVCHYRVL